MMTTRDALTELARTLEADLEAIGWDKPSRLYLVRGTTDPWLELQGELGDVYESLRTIPPIPPTASGVALASEAWVLSPSAEEIEALCAQMRQAGIPDHRHGAVLSAFYDALVRQLPIRYHPDRKELRQVVIITREGEIVVATRLRGEDAKFPDTAEFTGRIVDELKRIATTT